MMLAACGNRCDLCPRFTATQSGDPERLRAVAELWQQVGFRDRMVGNDEIACNGCEDQACPHQVRECAAERGVPHCGACPDFAGCATVARMLAKTADHALRCRVLAGDAFAELNAAFFRKQENLQQANARNN